MKNKFVLRTLLMAMVLFAPFHVNGQKSWHDFEIDLNTCGLITAEEMPSENQPSLSFGIAVGEDGTLTRVAADVLRLLWYSITSNTIAITGSIPGRLPFLFPEIRESHTVAAHTAAM